MFPQSPPPGNCSLADTLGMGMEPLNFPHQESVDLEGLLDDTLFTFPFEEEEWVDCLLDDAFQVDVSIPFDDFGSEDAPAFAEETVSNPQISEGGSATESRSGSVIGVDEGNGEMVSGTPPLPTSSSFSPPSPGDSSSDHSTVVEDDQRKRKREVEAEDGDKHGLISSSDTTETRTISSSTRSRCTGDEDEKRQARLMRNRESAQLSRQRKKSYIDELEDKVKSMNSTIAELNNTIAFMNTENIKLKQQLGVLCQTPNTANQHPVAPLPLPYLWPPFPAYPAPVMGAGSGGRVPLLPIPRLKSHSQQQPPTPCKDRKPSKSAAAVSSEQKPSKKRIKKVASVAFLGFFFIFLLLGGICQLFGAKHLRCSESNGRELFGNSIEELYRGNVLLKPRRGGRVLTSWDKGVNSTEFTVSNNPLGDVHVDIDIGTGRLPGPEKRNEKRNATYTNHYTEPDNDRMKMNSYIYPENRSSTALVASLFVPRNDKLVKIDGNLIIHAVLAGERASRASSSSQSRGDTDGHVDTISLKKESENNSLAVRTERHRALAAAAAATTDSGRNVDTNTKFLGDAAENPNYRALASNFGTSYKEDMESTAVDRSLQQWFQEGLAGPVLSSGMCTEVFQFDASQKSPSTTATSKLVTNVAARVANNSGGQSSNNSSGSKINEARRSDPVYLSKNRRVSYAVPLPPARPPFKDRNERNFTDHAEIIHEERGYRGNNTTPSSMVVSILVDPREISDDGMLSSGKLSRIFVVVLVDSVKYVTYSCVLPSKGSGPHLVTR